jgi:iron complex outermembrane receptor protein
VATRSFEVGDARLRSEVAYTVDAAAHYEAGPLSADLHLFAAKYDRFIDLKPTGLQEDGLPVFAYSQTDADFHGAEAEMSYRAWSVGSRRINVEAAADIVRASGENGRLARIPPPAVTLRAVYEAPKWSARAEVRNVWEQNRVAAFELPTDGYTQVNAFIGFRPWANERLTLFLDARNLTDAEIREHVSVLKDLAPQPGRSFRIGLSSRF